MGEDVSAGVSTPARAGRYAAFPDRSRRLHRRHERTTQDTDDGRHALRQVRSCGKARRTTGHGARQTCGAAQTCSAARHAGCSTACREAQQTRCHGTEQHDVETAHGLTPVRPMPQHRSDSARCRRARRSQVQQCGGAEARPAGRSGEGPLNRLNRWFGLPGWSGKWFRGGNRSADWPGRLARRIRRLACEPGQVGGPGRDCSTAGLAAWPQGRPAERFRGGNHSAGHTGARPAHEPARLSALGEGIVQPRRHASRSNGMACHAS